MKDKKGPHGKNLKEGGFEGSGTDGGPLPEPGSMEDPARLAELNLIAKAKKVRGGGVGNKELRPPQEHYEVLPVDEQA
jgi:hypothetical protein